MKKSNIKNILRMILMFVFCGFIFKGIFRIVISLAGFATPGRKF